MKTKVVVCLLAMISFFSLNLRAQDPPKVDVFAGYTYIKVNPSTSGVDGFHLNGGSISGAYNFKNWLGAVADFGGGTNGNIAGSGVSGSVYTYLFGPRVSYRHLGRITPFGQVLFGAAHETASGFGASGSQNAFAMTVGGGVDYKLTNRFSIRPIQVEDLITRFPEGTAGNQTQNNLRVSTGFVVHF